MTVVEQKRKRFISFSGGVESTSMCVLCGNNATPIFADTGFEHKALYDQIDKVETRLREIFGCLDVVRIKAENVEGTGCSTLPDYIRHRTFYPNPMARFCTRLFKIKPINDFLSTQGDCDLLIGLNADEADEREGNYCQCKNVSYQYPLVGDGMDRGDCEDLLKSVDLYPNFPPYMNRGGCVGCFFKRKNEYQALALLAPDEAEFVADLEESIQGKKGKYYHLHSSIPNMREFILDVQKGTLHFSSNEELYAGTKPSGSGCGVFCHR